MGAHIASGLGSGGVSIELVASGMNMGVRTLQRRLSEQGLDFTQVVEDVRRSLAEEYIARSDYSFTNIALLLGYSEASSFSRAFRRWNQLTPLEYGVGGATEQKVHLSSVAAPQTLATSG